MPGQGNKHTKTPSEKNSTSQQQGSTTSDVLTLQKCELVTRPGQTRKLCINNDKKTIFREEDVSEDTDNDGSTDNCKTSQLFCEEYQTPDECARRKVSPLMEDGEIETKSFDRFEDNSVCRETTSNDINRLVAGAIRMLDEAYSERNVEKNSWEKTISNNGVLKFNEEKTVN